MKTPRKTADTDPKLWKFLMRAGAFSGCHQMRERSFSFRGHPFPVCARCTGVALGNLAAIGMYFVYLPHWLWLISGCYVMFVDWLIQYLGLLESSNIRRLLTGILGGYSLTSLYATGLTLLFKAIFRP